MDWDRLKLFLAVADARSFSEAARKTGGSQSALSRQIQQLEHEMGAPLFHRHARGLVLTADGEKLAATARDVQDKIERTHRIIQAGRSRPSGELRVTTTVGFGSNWLTKHLTGFFEQYPDIQLSLILTDDDLDLSQRQADVAIRLHAPKQADLIQRQLATVHQYICAAPSYLAERGAPKSLEELNSHRLIVYGSEAPELFRDINWLLTVGTSGTPRVPALSVNNVSGVAQALETGLGIGALPSYILNTHTGLQRVLPDVEGPTFPIYYVYPAELKQSARVSALKDYLVRQLERSAGEFV
jgi:DNA-binding transcriptional LysR family regulator